MFQTVQAKIIFAFAIILLIAEVIAGYIVYGALSGSIGLAIAIFLGIPIVLLLTYDTNCLIVGNCSVWSWIRSAIYLSLISISVIYVVYSIVMFKKIQQIVITQTQEEEKPKTTS